MADWYLIFFTILTCTTALVVSRFKGLSPAVIAFTFGILPALWILGFYLYNHTGWGNWPNALDLLTLFSQDMGFSTVHTLMFRIVPFYIVPIVSVALYVGHKRNIPLWKNVLSTGVGALIFIFSSFFICFWFDTRGSLGFFPFASLFCLIAFPLGVLIVHGTNFRPLQGKMEFNLLTMASNSGGVLSVSSAAEELEIPEIEVRSILNSMAKRGEIKLDI
tara:strand:- start:9 stop:665 length:657 start_codon:yes stop_codon:yes gene_type:complete